MKRLLARGGPLGVFAEYPILARLALICVCAETAWATLLIVMEFYFKEELLRGYSDQYIASRVATTFLAFVGVETFFKYPMGRLADKYGPRPFVLLSLGICSVTGVLMFFAGRQWWHFMPFRAIDGFAAAALWPAMSALMARSVPREAKAASMSVFNAAYCLGLAIGPMTGLFIGHAMGGNRYVFPFCGLIMLVGLGIAYFSLAPEARTAQDTAQNAASSNPTNSDSTASASQKEPQKSLLRNRPILWRMMILYALSQIGTGILAPTIPIYMDSQFGIAQKDLTVILIVPALLIAAVAIPLGRLPDSIGRVRAVLISYAMAAAGMALVALSSLFPAVASASQKAVGSLNGAAGNALSAAGPSLTSLPVLVFGLGMLLFVGSYILGTPAWLGLTSLQVDDRKQAQALSLMQTAQGVGVVIAFALVASAGHLMTQWHKVGARVDAVLHRNSTHLIDTTKDTVPLSVWFWVACLLFLGCLIGTLVFIKEPPHDTHQKELARQAEHEVMADHTNA